MNFTKDYYQTRNYRDYLNRRFDELAKDVDEELCLGPNSLVIDFGCGYGGLVQSLIDRGIEQVIGTDISHWAIEYGRKNLNCGDCLFHYSRSILEQQFDWLIVLDVLEHVPEFEIESILTLATRGCKNGMLVRIPVSANEGERFVLDVSNNDPTHITCHTKDWWLRKFAACGWRWMRRVERKTIYDSHGVMVAVFGKDDEV